MVKIGDLIKDSEFIKAEGFDDLKPEVTITLPTYKRGDNGLFRCCVESLLNQNFTNFELIIIDDASVDSTFSQIQKFMKKDPRIAVIRHKKNIGLPAVSQYEAFFVARSDKFFYAFDDCEFDPKAIETLHNYMLKNKDVKFVHGVAEEKRLHGSNNLVGNKYSYNSLLMFNCIPNSVVLLDRQVVEKIGYYDPHVAITRLCDWDLWIRVGREFDIHSIPDVLVVEKGCIEKDSLHSSYPIYYSLAKDWMHALERNEVLKPENILNYEIDDKPFELSSISKNMIDKTLKEKFYTYYWYTEVSEDYKGFKYITVLVYLETSSVSLVFNTLSKEIKDNIIIKTYSEFNRDIGGNLLQAKALIFTREIDILELAYANLCKLYNVPYYYFTDDNLFELGLTQKSDKTMNFVKYAKGCILSSDALIDYFKENNLNDKFYSVIPAISEQQRKDLVVNLDKYSEPKQINFLLASNHRLDGVLKMTNVFLELAKEYSLKFFIFFKNEQLNELKAFHRICSKNNITIEYLDCQADHRFFIKKIAGLNIHFILHPQSFDNNMFKINHKNKTLNFLINAYLSSSFIFVPNVEPYSILKNESMVSNLVYDSNQEVYYQIKKILSDSEYTKNLFNSFENYCLKNFDAKVNEKIFLDILEELESQKVSV